MESGFSRKSSAPSLVALTAVSMLPWPEITTTAGRSGNGICWMRASTSSPSRPGSQISSSTSSKPPPGKVFQAFFAGGHGIRPRSLRLPGRRSATDGCRVRHPQPGCAAASYRNSRRVRRPGIHGAASALADGGNFDNEARSGWLIVFHANMPVVLGDDVAHNRKTQAGAAILGGKVGQEELLLIVAS